MPFAITGEVGLYSVHINGDAEIYPARNDPRAFIVCVFGPGPWRERPREYVRVAFHEGRSLDFMRTSARPGPCPHAVPRWMDPPPAGGAS